MASPTSPPSNANPNDSQTPLFSPTLISQAVISDLPDGYSCRPLQRSDYHNGFLDVLRVLTSVGDIDEARWTERFEWMSRRNDEYYLLCVLDAQRKVVGTGALVVERKLYVRGLSGEEERVRFDSILY